MVKSTPIDIRDPIHGPIFVSANERALIDSNAFQRLRRISQMGFAEMAFPGATHSRYMHSLGAMHVATRIFDNLFPPSDPNPLSKAKRNHFRQMVRVAMLFHDLGHAPMSHCTEVLMPNVGDLKLESAWIAGDKNRQACHEDYTLKMVLDSRLTDQIEDLLCDSMVTPTHIASLISGMKGAQDFSDNGHDYFPILQQIISSECDADRMDYLSRDSFYCGVNYGKFDIDWLVSNTIPIYKENRVFLGFRSRAMFGFEDFLISRYHMFATVYFHHIPVMYDAFLHSFGTETRPKTLLPTHIDDYIALDDIAFWHMLRQSDNVWAKRITMRQSYALLDQNEQVDESDSKNDWIIDHNQLLLRLSDNQIPCIHKTRFKNLFFRKETHEMFVLTHGGTTVSLQKYSHLFTRYKNPAKLSRVYVPKKYHVKAKGILDALIQGA